MRIVRFIGPEGEPVYGSDNGDGTANLFEGDFPTLFGTTRRAEIGKILPVVVPTDILCIGLNYRKHAEETGATVPEHPMLFIKASNALAAHEETIALPRNSQEVDYEAELAIVIGKTGKNIPRSRALKHVFGYTCANDVSAREWQKRKELGGGQFSRGKSFDGFCPLGPEIVTAEDIPHPNALPITTRLNGQVMQQSNTSDMIFDVPTLIESLSSTMTLRAGAVILTGTPEGVGMARKPPVFIKDGDTVEVEIGEVGLLRNTFKAEPTG